MKKLFILLLVLVSANSVFSQGNKWFVGLGVGSMFNSEESAFVNNVGGVSGTVVHTQPTIDNGAMYELSAGYVESKNVVFYLAYQYFGDYNYKFNNQFISTGTESDTYVTGKLRTQALTLNVNYMINPLSFNVSKVSIVPYAGIGAGLAYNSLIDGDETFRSSGEIVTTFDEHTHKGPVAQGRLGLNATLNRNIGLGLEYELTALDRFESNDYRNYENNIGAISRYRINNVFYNTVKLKLSYNF